MSDFNAAIRNAMYSSQEGYVSAVIDSIEFDLERKLTEDKCQAVEKFVDGVITAGLNTKDIKSVGRAALDYIDAIPKDVVATLPAMPGFDRDWAENVLAGGVTDLVLEQVIPTDDRFTVDMSGAKQGVPEDAERKAAFIDALRARDMAGFTKEQLIAYAQDRIEATIDSAPPHKLATKELFKIALAALTGELMREALDDCSALMDTDCVMDSRCISYDDAAAMTSGATALHDALLQWELK